MSTARIIVAGSVNLDIVATGSALPAPGETVTGAKLARYPGGKGANQALAAARLGAEVSMIARVGKDAEGELALALLRREGVDLSRIVVDPEAASGVALIAVSREGENQIVVAPGANDRLAAEDLGDLSGADAVLCQLEVPVTTVAAAAERAGGLFSINLAPARPLPKDLLRRAGLIVVNDIEAGFYGDSLRDASGWVAVTHGAKGASLYRAGELVVRASPPPVKAVDTTGAGDAFTAGLTVAFAEGKDAKAALRFACAVGALTATRPGAQPALPWRDEVDALLS